MNRETKAARSARVLRQLMAKRATFTAKNDGASRWFAWASLGTGDTDWKGQTRRTYDAAKADADALNARRRFADPITGYDRRDASPEAAAAYVAACTQILRSA